MDRAELQEKIDQWIETRLEVTRPELNGWSPCPYARASRLKQTYRVEAGQDIHSDLQSVADTGMGDSEVVIFAYPPEQYTAEELFQTVDQANQQYLLELDLIALDDHPEHKETVNGVCFNQGEFALALVQCLSDLNSRAKQMAQKGFYQEWPEEYLQDVFRHREDPRTP